MVACHRKGPIPNDAICLASSHVSRCRFGAKMDGRRRRGVRGAPTIIITDCLAILPVTPMSAVGFNGIVATGWGDGFLRSMMCRFGGGALFVVTQERFARAAAGGAISHVGRANGRRSFNGPIIRSSS